MEVSDMETTDIAARTAAMMPELIKDLEHLVAIPSVAFPGYPAEPVHADGRGVAAHVP